VELADIQKQINIFDSLNPARCTLPTLTGCQNVTTLGTSGALTELPTPDITIKTENIVSELTQLEI
jgi:hypothetical protein